MNTRAARYGLTIVLAIYGFVIARDRFSGSFMDLVDLPIHETGHLLFTPFGEFMHFLGGTLFQVIMPALFVAYFVRRKDLHSASVALWWIAQNFWNISIYVRDARNQDLDLVGGGEHDWAYLLGELGWLKHDQQLADGAWLIGVCLYVVAILGGLVVLNNATAETDASAEAVSG